MIESEASDLQTNETLQDEIEQLEKKFSSLNQSESDYERIKQAYKQHVDNFRRLLAKKQAVFLELLASVQELMSLNDAYVKNEQVKMQLKVKQDVNRLQIKELKAQV